MVLVQNVSKLYRLYNRPSDRLFELLPFRKAPLHTNFWALKNVSFTVEPGEILGIVGPNGSGKSTLLQVVSGILRPTSGRVSIEGRVAALLELGAAAVHEVVRQILGTPPSDVTIETPPRIVERSSVAAPRPQQL